jgi:hypothetical protein
MENAKSALRDHVVSSLGLNMATHTRTCAFDLHKTHGYTPTHEMHYEYMFLYTQPQFEDLDENYLQAGELKIETSICAGTDVPGWMWLCTRNPQVSHG